MALDLEDRAHRGGPPRSRRRKVSAAGAILAAFLAGITVDAFALHLGEGAPATRVVIGQQVVRPKPPARQAERPGAPGATSGPSFAWSTPVTIDAGFVPQGLSCPTASFCVAVDNGGRALVYDSGTWEGASDVDGAVEIDSVSCPTAKFCMAVDQAGNAITFNGSAWSHPERIDKTPFPELTSVSCASPTFCAAVDGDGNALVYDGTSWSPPYPADGTGWSGGSRDAASVACPAEGFCVGVDAMDQAFYYAGKDWEAASAIGPTIGEPPVEYRNAVACATPTACVAADNPGAVRAYNGTQWSDPVPIDSGNYLESLSCPSATFCAAVDGLLPPGFGAGTATGDVVLYDGVSWSTPRNIDGGGILSSVSCSSQGFCMALDQGGRAVSGVATG